ncbi:MAG: hypothetical protein M1833_002541 [Piccolia ochrophora]|nr:MAG: hypothetical protein M1833_002541 [Piccolia ochrophora]
MQEGAGDQASEQDESPAADDPQQESRRGSQVKESTTSPTAKRVEVDEFGLPVRTFQEPQTDSSSSDEYDSAEEERPSTVNASNGTPERFAPETQSSVTHVLEAVTSAPEHLSKLDLNKATNVAANDNTTSERKNGAETATTRTEEVEEDGRQGTTDNTTTDHAGLDQTQSKHSKQRSEHERMAIPDYAEGGLAQTGASEWSHQQIVPQTDERGPKKPKDEDWQEMPAFAPFDLYDDDGKLVAREAVESDDEAATYAGLGGAGKGYTKVNLDEDAQSATSMDENTKYLFKEPGPDDDDDIEGRDALAQMQATKDLLTEQQRIAYVALVRVAMVGMLKAMEAIEPTKATKKDFRVAMESLKMWTQKMMVRLYAHMDISQDEQLMIEQLAEHGVEPGDLTPTLMQNSRVKNPVAEINSPQGSPRPGSRSSVYKSPNPSFPEIDSNENSHTPPPPAYQETETQEMPEVRMPSQLPATKKIDIDLRWTVLCDLFLVLIADSIYDSRSRVLLERVGSFMDVPWLDICTFEKRVTDALEMQEAADKENWNEDEHMENRRKLAVKRRIVMMGLATVGGSLVIGLSAGLMAPVIGAGLAAGFTTFGVAGTGTFLAGAGGAAMITTTGLVAGGTIAVRASSRRLGPVRTFEYRPLHNNKRVNLIVTISGWMNGKVDDVRLPYSTIDPIMGDIYSVLWEPEMLQSTGQTINILATEALTQGLQQLLGSTILIGLMASLQLPIVLTKLSYLIDNPWTVSLDRANSAGLILADSLIDRNLGVRPVTLVGFSLGSRVIYSCLKELAHRGAHGLVQNAYLFGSPVVAKTDEWLRIRSIVSGRLVSGYARNDWILGYLFRATSGGIMRVAGLAPVEGVTGLENIDVTEFVPGHMSYRAAMPRLLREMGWSVESDEFAEIEDPDPGNHEKRQREIIAEMDEARKELEKEPKKRRFGLFGRNKKVAEKKAWEMYDEKLGDPRTNDESDKNHQRDTNVLFDIDAIRAELASEQIEVREIPSTLPPMRLDSINSKPGNEKIQQGPYSNLRMTKSFDVDRSTRSNHDASSSMPILAPGSHTHDSSHEQSPNPPPYGSPPLTNGAALSSHATPEILAGSSRLSSISDAMPSPARVASLRHEEDPAPAHRPRLLTSHSSPLGISNLEHNAWVDDGDEFAEQGGGEVTMSFE